MLTHLLISEFAVLLFGCERYRLAAESCQQLYFYLRAIKVFCSAFLQKSAFPRFLCSFLFKKESAYPFVLLNNFAFFESAAEKSTEEFSGDKFTGKHGKNDKPESVGKAVSVLKDERDYHGICDNCRNRVQPHAL